MDQKTYDRLTNICILVAAASAILFQRLEGRWLFGAIGIAAGVGAVAVYFVNQRRTRLQGRGAAVEKPTEVAKQPIQGAPVRLVDRAYRYYGAPNVADDWATSWHQYGLHPASTWRVLESQRRWVFAEMHVLKPLAREVPAPRLEDRVVEIVQRLCADEKSLSLEFKLAPDGSFTIRTFGKTSEVRQDETGLSDEAELPSSSAFKPN